MLISGCPLYTLQHVLQRGKPLERSKIIRKLSGHIVQLSQHKFASNVIEKCLVYGGPAERELIIEEILGHNEETLLVICISFYGLGMKDNLKSKF